MDRAADARILDVAIDLFGRAGVDAVSTRAIAEAAGAQQSAISYHFGTKDRLYIACAERIAEMMRERLVPLGDDLALAADPQEARRRIEAIMTGLLRIMLDEGMAPVARFVVREQMSPTAAFDVLWSGAIRHVAEPLIGLLRVALPGRHTDEALRVRCFSLVGQVFAFRFGQASMLRVTGWPAVGPREAALAQEAVRANVRAILADPAPSSRN
jgi:AcrR family transcriptional regulator